MYGHSNDPNEMLPYTTEFPFQFQFSDHNLPLNFPTVSPPPALAIPMTDYDSYPAMRSEFSHSSSGCSSFSSPTSLTSYGNNHYGSPSSVASPLANNPNLIMQRSISSHSLQKNGEGFSGLISSPSGYADLETSPVRKVFSTGDLQGMHMMHQSNRSESALQQELSIIESMSKACRYSPEEKKERIERYRSKRNQRNFNKKIKYECRKTLADSRPRIRGRFARNDELEKTYPSQWDQAVVEEEDDEGDENWISFLMQYQQM